MCIKKYGAISLLFLVLPLYLRSSLCGFSDPKYFSRLFKKCMGMTPSEYMGK